MSGESCLGDLGLQQAVDDVHGVGLHSDRRRPIGRPRGAANQKRGKQLQHGGGHGALRVRRRPRAAVTPEPQRPPSNTAAAAAAAAAAG